MAFDPQQTWNQLIQAVDDDDIDLARRLAAEMEDGMRRLDASYESYDVVTTTDDVQRLCAWMARYEP